MTLDPDPRYVAEDDPRVPSLSEHESHPRRRVPLEPAGPLGWLLLALGVVLVTLGLVLVVAAVAQVVAR